MEISESESGELKSDSEAEYVDAEIENNPNYVFFLNYGWGLSPNETGFEDPPLKEKEPVQMVSVAVQTEDALCRCVDCNERLYVKISGERYPREWF